MPELKNHDRSKAARNLKKADSEKSSGGAQHDYVVGLRGVKAKDSGAGERKSASARKRLPLIVDIIITVLIFAMVAGIISGAYYLFRYYSTDYESVSIKYSFAVECEGNASEYQKADRKELYFDTDGSTEYFGRITAVSISEDNSLAVFTVEVTANYKASEGYFLGDERVAVGSDYTLRIEGQTVSGTVVELIGGN